MIDWDSSPKLELKLSELYDKYGNNYQTIADELNTEFNLEDKGKKVTYNAIRNRIRRSSIIDYIPNKHGEGIFDNLDYDNYVNIYDETKELIIEAYEFFEENFENSKVLFISDLHIPKLDIEISERIILNNQDADVLVIGGDFLDYDSISVFGSKRNIDVKEEYKMAFEFLKTASKIFNQIFIYHGNHEFRLVSYFEKKTVNALSDFLLEKHKPLNEVTKYFENIVYVPHWFIQLGNMIYAHPFKCSKIQLRTGENAIENRILHQHNQEFFPFDGMVIGHSHRIGKGELLGKFVIESGCLINLNVDYKNERDGGQRWSNGYTIIEYNDGKANFNSSQVKKVE